MVPSWQYRHRSMLGGGVLVWAGAPQLTLKGLETANNEGGKENGCRNPGGGDADRPTQLPIPQCQKAC